MLVRRITDWPAGTLARPFEELERMRRQMDRLMGGLSRGLFREPAAGVFPLVNITEDGDSYYVRAELPGLKAEDLDISVTGDSLSISGERKLHVEEEHAQFHRREREAGRFSRIISMPTQIDTGKVEAHCIDGVLTVILPKAEAARPKQIAVKAS